MEPPVQGDLPGVSQRLVEVLSEVVEGVGVVPAVQLQRGSDHVEVLLGAELGEAGGDHHGQEGDEQGAAATEG